MKVYHILVFIFKMRKYMINLQMHFPQNSVWSGKNIFCFYQIITNISNRKGLLSKLDIFYKVKLWDTIGNALFIVLKQIAGIENGRL